MTTEYEPGENARTAKLIASLRASAELAMKQRDTAQRDLGAMVQERDDLMVRVRSLQAALGKTLAEVLALRDELSNHCP